MGEWRRGSSHALAEISAVCRRCPWGDSKCGSRRFACRDFRRWRRREVDTCLPCPTIRYRALTPTGLRASQVSERSSRWGERLMRRQLGIGIKRLVRVTAGFLQGRLNDRLTRFSTTPQRPGEFQAPSEVEVWHGPERSPGSAHHSRAPDPG